MPLAHLSNRSLSNVRPTDKPYFIRGTTLHGLGVKIRPKGLFKFIVKVWVGQPSTRKTIGEYPFMPVQEAVKEFSIVISYIISGLYEKKLKEKILDQLFREYLSTRQTTQKEYRYQL